MVYIEQTSIGILGGGGEGRGMEGDREGETGGREEGEGRGERRGGKRGWQDETQKKHSMQHPDFPYPMCSVKPIATELFKYLFGSPPVCFTCQWTQNNAIISVQPQP